MSWGCSLGGETNRSAEFVHFKLCCSGYGNRPKAASPESGTCATYQLYAHATDAPTPPKRTWESRKSGERDLRYLPYWEGKEPRR
jgi:hypothetical protein